MSEGQPTASIRLDKTLDALIEKNAKIDRLQTTIHKLSKISGVDISELIDEGYLEDGDMS